MRDERGGGQRDQTSAVTGERCTTWRSGRQGSRELLAGKTTFFFSSIAGTIRYPFSIVTLARENSPSHTHSVKGAAPATSQEPQFIPTYAHTYITPLQGRETASGVCHDC